ncbi:MAG: phosphomannomutase/phosphoglucomutase [Bacilli bacterium]|nr:phosphomannomutase/phosphoglucomutase [Bacilli bacterium]
MKIINDINYNIFRGYDIRGIYETDLNEDVAYTIGRGFGTYIKSINQTNTLIGYDNRLSSVPLSKALIQGINDSGIDVVNIGLVTTPMYYSSWDFLNIKSGIMVTASHNPKEYNGFKISYNGSTNACGDEIQMLKDIIIKGEFSSGNGSITYEDTKERYFNLLLSDIKLGDRLLKVVIDCGNGTTSVIAKEIFDQVNIDYIPLFFESDPNFPNHHPDPSVEKNLEALKNEVIKKKADLGVAFDGDGDRIGVVDELGNMIEIDKFMIIIWRDIINKVKNKTALYDVKCSKTLEDEIIKLGGTPLCYKTGNSYLRAKMVEDNLSFGGELAGHVFFNDRFPGYDSGIYASLRLIEILSKTNKTVSGLLEGINKYYNTPEILIKVTDENKFKIVDKVKEYCLNKNYNILSIDGVKVLFDDGFALIRASNTGPNITLRFESKTLERLELIKNEFLNLIEKIK